jgi:redox-sensitive bicupin YhaK (pirin superfamily)
MRSSIDLVIAPRERSIGSMNVLRILPFRQRRQVGPFVFLDQMGPVTIPAGVTQDVLSHPHIGLATVTYLLEGTLRHRNSLGTVQDIVPEDVNWMSAGRGIVHSERTPPDLIDRERRLYGLQAWVALPMAHEAGDPDFQHHPAATLPKFEIGGARMTLIAGEAFGRTSPVRTLSRLFYLDLHLEAGGSLTMPTDGQEAAIYLIEGQATIEGQVFEAPQMVVFQAGSAPTIETTTGLSGVLLGGDPPDGPRHIWWNFVASSPERIEQAKRDWQAQRFPTIAGEVGFVPLPEG